MTLKFINPFIGTPSKIPLTGLFLFHPQIYYDIEGYSISYLFKSIEKESLLKRIQAIKNGTASLESINSVIHELENDSCIPEHMRRQFSELKEIAIKEEEAGGFVPESVGEHEFLIRMCNPDGQPKSKVQIFLLELEEKSQTALGFLSKYRYLDAAQAILDEEFFSPFVWEGMHKALKNVSTKDTFFLLRASIAMEVFLATIIISESSYEETIGHNDVNSILDIWPVSGTKSKNPFGMLFEWTKREAGVSTLRGFFDHPKLVTVEMEEQRLKRWSSGSHQPRKEWLDDIAAALWDEPNHLAFKIRISLAQQINFLGYMSQQIISNIPSTMSIRLAEQIYPWPNFPYDHPDFASWGKSRYSFWREYARNYQAKSL